MAEHAALVGDAEKLERSLAAVQDIIRAQQSVDGPTEVLQSVELSDTINGALAVIEPSFLRHRVKATRTVEHDVRTMLDRSKFQQVLLNLVTNAVQASEQHRVVHIEAGLANPQTFFVEVRDGGMGFDEVRKAKLFTQGYTTRDDGHGLGLHYCANAIKQMNGTISAYSDGPGLGATFRIELPIRLEGLADEPAQAEQDGRKAA
jgi:two-component system, NtrC family, sensor kinase